MYCKIVCDKILFVVYAYKEYFCVKRISFILTFKKGRFEVFMKHIKVVVKNALSKTVVSGGCGECQASCQSACKTSCTVGNQICKNRK